MTEAGSRGSPLLNANKEIIGQLYGGASSCNNPSGIDLFGRFDLTYDTIWPWLDNGPPPVPLSTGNYNGLFADTNNMANSGFFTLKVTERRTYSGSVQLGGKKYSLSGLLNIGPTTRIVPRGSGSLRITMGSDPVLGPDRLAGTVSADTWHAELNADRAVFDRRTNPAALFAGKYTLVLPGSDSDASVPHGNGYGAVFVVLDGKVALRGSLADGMSWSRTVTLAGNGEWPLFASLYRGTGSVLGWMHFDSLRAPAGLSGSLHWFKPAHAQDTM